MLTQVAEGVLVHRSALLRNNAVVVVGPTGALLVDPGLTHDELVCLADDLRARDLPVVAGFATHPDWDHALWHPAFGDVPRYGTARCAAVLADLRDGDGADWRERVRGALPPEIVDDVPLGLFGLVTALPAGATAVPWDGPRVRVVEHPAHSPGHAALLVEGSGVLVAGDMLSDVFVPMLDDPGGDGDPVEDYLAGLRALEQVTDAVRVVVPGHGSVGVGDQVRARTDLDRAYVRALRDGTDPDDPRISGPTVEPGWEWVADIHAGQAHGLAERRRRLATSG